MLKISVIIVGLAIATHGIAVSEAEEEVDDRSYPDTVKSELIYPRPEGRDMTVDQVLLHKEPELERHRKILEEKRAEEEARRLAEEERVRKLKEQEAKERAQAQKEAEQVAAEEAKAQEQTVQEQSEEVAEEKPVQPAVASQSSQPASSYLLAQLVESEATGEPYAGKVAVAEVVLNRVNDSGFPNSIEGVIYQPGQFQVVSNGSINNTPSQESINASNEALAGSNYTYGALYFYNASTATDRWQDSLRTTTVIGSHTFNAKN